MSTKLELEAANAALTAQVAQLDADIAMLQGACTELSATNHRLQCELITVTDVASAINQARSTRPDYTMPAWQRQRAEEMAKAKAAAMTHHCVVKV